MIRRLRIALAGMILPAGSTVLLPLTDEEVDRLNVILGDNEQAVFCDDPTCLCRVQVRTTEPEGGV